MYINKLDIERIWKYQIKADYKAGILNSERCLQASLYFHLRKLGSDSKIFVEPKLDSYEKTDLKGKVPDLMICRGNEIEHIFELKFVPQGLSDFLPDFKKFETYFSSPRVPLLIDLEPETGTFSDNRFSISDRTECHFMVIANLDKDAAALDKASIIDEIRKSAIEPQKLGKIGLHFGMVTKVIENIEFISDSLLPNDFQE